MKTYDIQNELRENEETYEVFETDFYFQLIEKIIFIKNCQRNGKYCEIINPGSMRTIEYENKTSFKPGGAKLFFEIQNDIDIHVLSESYSEESASDPDYVWDDE